MHDSSAEIQGLVERLQAGDAAARDGLIAAASVRLTNLTRKMLHDNPRVRRWEQTDDVFQNAAIRLYRALDEVRPATARDFFRLAAAHVRRELIDLARHHYGPEGGAAHHSSHNGNSPVEHPEGGAERPENIAAMAEFHRSAGELPDEEREIFDLLWYQELSQLEAATLLGVSERTVKRRWQSARLMLAGAVPEVR